MKTQEPIPKRPLAKLYPALAIGTASRWILGVIFCCIMTCPFSQAHPVSISNHDLVTQIQKNISEIFYADTNSVSSWISAAYLNEILFSLEPQTPAIESWDSDDAREFGDTWPGLHRDSLSLVELGDLIGRAAFLNESLPESENQKIIDTVLLLFRLEMRKKTAALLDHSNSGSVQSSSDLASQALLGALTDLGKLTSEELMEHLPEDFAKPWADLLPYLLSHLTVFLAAHHEESLLQQTTADLLKRLVENLRIIHRVGYSLHATLLSTLNIGLQSNDVTVVQSCRDALRLAMAATLLIDGKISVSPTFSTRPGDSNGNPSCNHKLTKKLN